MVLTKATYSMIDGAPVNVKDFGAACDGITDDAVAVQAAIEYCKANGGGTVYFPGYCLVNSTINLYGAITGGPSFPIPSQAKVTLASNGNGGLKAGMSSGAVVQLSIVGTQLTFTVGFENFIIDCDNKNVTGINGQNLVNGLYNGSNHFVVANNLSIMRPTGNNSIGIDMGTITDSTFVNLVIQGGTSGVAVGVKIAKANNKFVNPMMSYCIYAVLLDELIEAQATMIGGRFLVNEYDLFYGLDTTYAQASVFSGCFLGEKDPGGTGYPRYIVGRIGNTILDVASLSFISCQFDTGRTTPLITIDFGCRLTMIGCYCLSAPPASNLVKLGQYCLTLWFGNSGMAIDPTSDALDLDLVNNLLTQNVTGITGGIDEAPGTDRIILNYYATAVTSGVSQTMSKDASTIKKYVMPADGCVNSITLTTSAAIATGSIACEIYKNGVNTNATATNLVPIRDFVYKTVNFSKGDELTVLVGGTAHTPSPIDAAVTVIVSI